MADKEMENMENSSVLVSGISDSTTDDALQNYFENKRRSSGGQVKEIKRLGAGQAVVTFESPITATRVIEWAKHILDDSTLTLKIPESPKTTTPAVAEPPMAEEKSYTIEVSGISPDTTKDALFNFFENKRRSGGGRVEDIQYYEDDGLAEITFIFSEDAENVFQKGNLMLDDAQLVITLKEIPLPKDPYKLYVRGLSDNTTKDGFVSYIEVVSDLEVQSTLFGNNSDALVTFEEPPDFEKVQTMCKNRLLDGSHLQVEQVRLCNCVEVSGFFSNPTHDTIFYYFENSRCGGGAVKKVEYTRGQTKALVFFEEPSVVDRVVKNHHKINGESLKVVPFYPFLGEVFEKPGKGKKRKRLSIDQQSISFIKKFFNQEFSDLLQTHEVKVTQVEDQVDLEPINTKMDQAKWDESCEAVETYINGITMHQVKVSPVAWEETVPQAKQRFTSDKIDIVYRENEQLIILQGKKQDVDKLAVQLDELSKETDRKIEYENTKITKKIKRTKAELNLFSLTAEIENLQTQYKDLEVKIDKNEPAICVSGPETVVKEGNISILTFLSKIKDQEMELPRSVVSILTSVAGKVYLSAQFKHQNIQAVATSSDRNDDTKLVITGIDRNEVDKAAVFLKDKAIEDNFSFEPKQVPLFSSDKWEQLDSDFKTSMLIKVKTDTASNNICIAGIKEEANFAKERVLNFLNKNTIIDKVIEAEPASVEYVLKFQEDEVKKVEEDPFVDKINSCENGFTIRGTKQGIETATTKVLQLVNQVKHKLIEIEKPGIKRLFSDDKGKKLLSIIENEQKCIIKQYTSYEDRKMNVVAGGGSEPKKICSYVTPQEKSIIVLQGDITEVQVDVMVNAANKQLKHKGGLAKAIVDKGGQEIQDECNAFISKNNELVDGEVFVSKPGKLPCKRLVHVVGPKWKKKSKTYGDKETKEEGILAQAVFNALENAKRYSSIAIPAISSGAFGFPVDICAKIILESVLAFSEQNAGAQLSKIYIIDTKGSVTTAFYKEMESKFGKEKFFTDCVAIHEGELAKASNIARRKRRVIAKDVVGTPDIKIEIIVDDLAKVEAHAVVNTVADDLDLSKNPCAKALSTAAGPNLQKECKRTGHLVVGELLVTKGYNLGCKNVFHVVVGTWNRGKGEKVLRELIVSCLKEADKRGFSNIAFPAIGTGNLGFPRNVVAKVFFEEITNFKKNNPQSSVLEVHLVLFHLDQPTIDAFQTEKKNWGKVNPTKENKQSQPYQDWKDEIKDTSTKEAYGDSKNASVGSVYVEVVPGDITKESTDAIVTVSDESLDVACCAVGAAVARAGGPSIQTECKRLGPQKPESVVITSAGNLPSKKLFHLVSGSYDPDKARDLVLKCLKLAESKGITSIAIPAVGTGNANNSPVDAAQALMTAIGKFCKTKPSSLKHIRVVVFQATMLQDFDRALDELKKKKSTSWGFSKITSLFCKSGENDDNTSSLYLEEENCETVSQDLFILQRPMSLKVFASSDSTLEKAEEAINRLITEHHETIIIGEPQWEAAIQGLSKAQEARILKLQEKYLTKIDIEKRAARILVKGLPNDVRDAKCEIYEILNEKSKEEHERKYAELVSKSVQWYYSVGDDTREPYDNMDNAKIERAFKDKKPSVLIQERDENDKLQRYNIVFGKMEEINLDNGDKNTVYREVLAKGILLPPHWDPQPVEDNDKEKDLHLVQLDKTKNQKEYDKVYNKISQSSTINIVKIERVQNPELYRAYIIKKQKMDGKDGSNEMSLFHGTAVETCNLINHKGFNRSYCGKNAVKFGKGVYFARDAKYSMRLTYSPHDANGNRCMYLANVLVGQYTVGNEQMITPPPKNPNNPTVTYDTTVNDVNDPQLFVAFHDNQVYPEYLITFK